MGQVGLLVDVPPPFLGCSQVRVEGIGISRLAVLDCPTNDCERTSEAARTRAGLRSHGHGEPSFLKRVVGGSSGELPCLAAFFSGSSRELTLDFPTNGGHPVKGVQSPWEVHHGENATYLHPRVQGRGRQARHRARLLRRRGRTLPRPQREPHPQLEARPPAQGNTPSPATASSPPSRRRTAGSAPRTSGSWRSATS